MLRVSGLAGLPTLNRAYGTMQFLFVNGRPVRDPRLIIGAIRGAYADFVPRGRHPIVALFVTVDPHGLTSMCIRRKRRCVSAIRAWFVACSFAPCSMRSRVTANAPRSRAAAQPSPHCGPAIGVARAGGLAPTLGWAVGRRRHGPERAPNAALREAAAAFAGSPGRAAETGFAAAPSAAAWTSASRHPHCSSIRSGLPARRCTRPTSSRRRAMGLSSSTSMPRMSASSMTAEEGAGARRHRSPDPAGAGDRRPRRGRRRAAGCTRRNLLARPGDRAFRPRGHRRARDPSLLGETDVQALVRDLADDMAEGTKRFR